ncbi:MAG: glycine cleavage system aminomethyltransferase GcvT [Lentisphaeria bacterium]|jgi:aminomethyltransferase
MRTTPLHDHHRQLGAKLAEFAGWLMPIQYPAGILAEHRHCRELAALFDICHMGEFQVRGPGAAAALDALLPRRASTQKPGACRYNFLLDSRGGTLDDLVVYRLAAEEFMLVVNAGTADADAAFLRERLPAGVEFRDLRNELGKLDLQGPESFRVLAACGVPETAIPPYFHWTLLPLFGMEVLLSRTGYTGERGVELYLPRQRVAECWERLLAQPQVKPVGLGARDTLRLEMGYPLYGHELDPETTPVEAGFATLLEPARAATLRTPQKRLAGFRLEGRRAARAGAPVRNPQTGEPCGIVTSGAFSPSLGRAVALGYVHGGEAPAPGSIFLLGEGAAPLPATVVELPFWRQGTARAQS